MKSGEIVSHYQIASLLGSGGMGVVYLAQDLSLGRKVALKFLSQQPDLDPTALERFRREAKAASALNHPNICTIYEISEHNGLPFIAMERLEGESLRDLLRQRRLSIDELLTLAIDIAEALDAAHRAGVVHRDIKPGNIFVLRHGHSKLLDFGLAKIQATNSIAASSVPTVDEPLTTPGMTFGTVAYMSPEQVKGETIDARTDLFSFGVVLYEALTGVTPFRGSSHGVVFHEILGAVPVSPSRLNPDTPPELDRLIIKALEKDRDVRCQSAAELLSDLKRLRRDRDTTRTVESNTPSNISQRASASASDVQVAADLLKRHRATVAVGAIALVLALAGTAYFLATHEAENKPIAGESLQIEQLTFTGKAENPAISPDGRFVAYAADNGLWIRQTATSINQRIVPPEPGILLRGATVTPDNNFVDFLRVPVAANTPPSLWRIPLIGGRDPKLLIEDVHSPPGWSPGGQMAFIRANSRFDVTSLMLADGEGRNEQILKTQKGPEATFQTVLTPGQPVVRPAWSLDGRLIAYPGVGVDTLLFVTVPDGSLTFGPPRSAGNGVAWMDRSSLIISRWGPTLATAQQLWTLTYPDGVWTRLTHELNTFNGVSLSADRNTLVTGRLEVDGVLWVANGDATAGTESAQPLADRSLSARGSLAWVGDRLLFTTRHPAIFELSVPGGQPKEFLKTASSPVATSDGKTFVYFSWEEGKPGLWRVGADGRNPVPLAAGDIWFPEISPDDQDLYYVDTSSGTTQIWTMPLGGGTPRLVTKLQAVHPKVSPDGKELAFASLEGGDQWFISVCKLPDCSNPRHVRAVNVRGFGINWTRDGRGIAYFPVTPGGNIFVQPSDGSPEQRLTSFTDERSIVDFEWSRDGKRLAVARASTSQDIVLFRGLNPN